MKKYVLLNLCLILLAATLRANDYPQKIEKIGQFTFPAAPQISDAGAMTNYLGNTDSCSYLVQIKPLVKAGVVKDTATLHSFYAGIVKGILRGAHGTLIGHKPVDIKGREGEELEYVKGDKDHQPVSVCSRILLINGSVVVYTFSAPFSNFIPYRHLQEHFFNSFIIDKDALQSELSTIDTSHTTAVDTELFPTPPYDSVSAGPRPAVVRTELVRTNTLHFIVSFALCILLLAATLYVLVRLKKRNSK